MKRSLMGLGLLAAVVVGVSAATLHGCTVVTPGGGQDAGVKIIPIPVHSDAQPPAKSLTASVLFVANLQRSSANLADAYSRIILGVTSYLNSTGLQLENMGLISTYSDQ